MLQFIITTALGVIIGAAFAALFIKSQQKLFNQFVNDIEIAIKNSDDIDELKTRIAILAKYYEDEISRIKQQK